MALSLATVELSAREDVDLPFGPNGTPIGITGNDLRFEVSDKFGNAPIFECLTSDASITITDGVNDLFVVHLVYAKTVLLSGLERAYWTVWRWDSGRKRVLRRGKFVIDPTVFPVP